MQFAFPVVAKTAAASRVKEKINSVLRHVLFVPHPILPVLLRRKLPLTTAINLRRRVVMVTRVRHADPLSMNRERGLRFPEAGKVNALPRTPSISLEVLAVLGCAEGVVESRDDIHSGISTLCVKCHFPFARLMLLVMNGTIMLVQSAKLTHPVLLSMVKQLMSQMPMSCLLAPLHPTQCV